MHFRHRTTCVEVERVRWVEWQQDKLLALGQARILSPEVEWPAVLRTPTALANSSPALAPHAGCPRGDPAVGALRGYPGIEAINKAFEL